MMKNQADTRENYNALRKRVRNAKGVQDLNRIELSCTRLYNAGQLSAKELERLDIFIMEEIARCVHE